MTYYGPAHDLRLRDKTDVWDFLEEGPGAQVYDDPLLNEREATHGSFGDKALLIQNIKATLRFEDGWETLTPVMQEALDMVVSKIGRIMTGNPAEIDHWRDLAGYAKLVVAELERQAKPNGHDVLHQFKAGGLEPFRL